MTAHRTRLEVDELGERVVPAITLPNSDVAAAIIATNPLATTAFRTATSVTLPNLSGAQVAAGFTPNVTNAIIATAQLAPIVLPGASLTATTSTATTTTTTTTITPTATHPLTGQGQGTFLNPVDPNALTFDALSTYNLSGTASLSGMGQVKVAGVVRTVGLVLTGQASGQMTFSNNRGSVTIALIGPVQAGYSPLPSVFGYKVTARTGAFAKLNDSGFLTLLTAPQLFNYVPQPKGSFAFAI